MLFGNRKTRINHGKRLRSQNDVLPLRGKMTLINCFICLICVYWVLSLCYDQCFIFNKWRKKMWCAALFIYENDLFIIKFDNLRIKFNLKFVCEIHGNWLKYRLSAFSNKKNQACCYRHKIWLSPLVFLIKVRLCVDFYCLTHWY